MMRKLVLLLGCAALFGAVHAHYTKYAYRLPAGAHLDFAAEGYHLPGEKIS